MAPSIVFYRFASITVVTFYTVLSHVVLGQDINSENINGETITLIPNQYDEGALWNTWCTTQLLGCNEICSPPADGGCEPVCVPPVDQNNGTCNEICLSTYINTCDYVTLEYACVCQDYTIPSFVKFEDSMHSMLCGQADFDCEQNLPNMAGLGLSGDGTWFGEDECVNYYRPLCPAFWPPWTATTPIILQTYTPSGTISTSVGSLSTTSTAFNPGFTSEPASTTLPPPSATSSLTPSSTTSELSSTTISSSLTSPAMPTSVPLGFSTGSIPIVTGTAVSVSGNSTAWSNATSTYTTPTSPAIQTTNVGAQTSIGTGILFGLFGTWGLGSLIL